MQQQGRRTLKATRARRPHTDYTGLKERNRAESGRSAHIGEKAYVVGEYRYPKLQGYRR